jgi:AcrR family transcriptional regulator
MARKKGSAREGGVRRKLLAEATRLFNRRGYASTSVREIVAAAGVTKPVLYHYFGSKEGLYLEIMNDFIASFDQVLGEFARLKGTAKERIVRFADDLFELCMGRIESVRLMYSSYYGPAQGAPRVDFDCLYARVFGALRGVMEQGIRAGEFRRGNATDMAWLPLGTMTMALEGELAPSGLRIGRAGMNRILNLTFAGIAAEKGTGHVSESSVFRSRTDSSGRVSRRHELFAKRRQ